MKNIFCHTMAAGLLFLARPLSCLAADEEALGVVSPQLGALDSMAAIGKLLAAFLIIAALMALLFKGMRKMGLGHGSPSQRGLISVLDTKMVAPKKYISVVRVAGEDLAIGISDNSFVLLSKLGPAPEAATPRQATTAFDASLDKAHSSRGEASHA